VFRGPAADDMGSAAFQASKSGLTAFPTEPAVQAETWAPVPGNLGQMWLGSTPSQVLTLTKALVRSTVPLYASIPVIAGFLIITHIQN